MPTEINRVTFRIPNETNARLDLAMARLKLDKGKAVSKNDVFLSLVDGFLSGRFQLEAFEGLDVATVVREAAGG